MMDTFDVLLTDLRTAVKACEKSHIRKLLKGYDGDKHKAAKHLGIGLSSLYRKIKELNIRR